MPTLPDAHLRGIPAQAEQELAAAELRRAQQAPIVAGPLDSPETRAAAELLLREIDRTIASIRANRLQIEDILACSSRAGDYADAAFTHASHGQALLVRAQRHVGG